MTVSWLVDVAAQQARSPRKRRRHFLITLRVVAQLQSTTAPQAHGSQNKLCSHRLHTLPCFCCLALFTHSLTPSPHHILRPTIPHHPSLPLLPSSHRRLLPLRFSLTFNPLPGDFRGSSIASGFFPTSACFALRQANGEQLSVLSDRAIGVRRAAPGVAEILVHRSLGQALPYTHHSICAHTQRSLVLPERSERSFRPRFRPHARARLPASNMGKGGGGVRRCEPSTLRDASASASATSQLRLVKSERLARECLVCALLPPGKDRDEGGNR